MVDYRRRSTFIAMLLLSMMLATATAALVTQAQEDALSAPEFRDTMRELWEDHIVWTRMYIISAVEGLPDQELVAQRLLGNQDEIGDTIKPFYGEAAGEALAVLLRDHILGAATLLDAAIAGDTGAVQTASDAWSKNADDIAAFLHAANPDHWPEAALAHEMHMHLELTLEEATARLEGDYAADIAAYDAVHQHILHMADLLSAGIMRQFPDRFAA